MMLSRVCPNTARPSLSVHTPQSSGPRRRSAASIPPISAAPGDGRVPIQPQIPHTALRPSVRQNRARANAPTGAGRPLQDAARIAAQILQPRRAVAPAGELGDTDGDVDQGGVPEPGSVFPAPPRQAGAVDRVTVLPGHYAESVGIRPARGVVQVQRPGPTGDHQATPSSSA